MEQGYGAVGDAGFGEGDDAEHEHGDVMPRLRQSGNTARSRSNRSGVSARTMGHASSYKSEEIIGIERAAKQALLGLEEDTDSDLPSDQDFDVAIGDLRMGTDLKRQRLSSGDAGFEGEHYMQGASSEDGLKYRNSEEGGVGGNLQYAQGHGVPTQIQITPAVSNPRNPSSGAAIPIPPKGNKNNNSSSNEEADDSQHFHNRSSDEYTNIHDENSTAPNSRNPSMILAGDKNRKKAQYHNTSKHSETETSPLMLPPVIDTKAREKAKKERFEHYVFKDSVDRARTT